MDGWTDIACDNNPKIDLWEIRGCAEIQEIERPNSNNVHTSLMNVHTSRLIMMMQSRENR
jgi:hypothetical protein